MYKKNAFAFFASLAAISAASAGQIQNTTIKSLWVNDSSFNAVFVEPTKQLTIPCGGAGTTQGKYFMFDESLPNSKEIYSMVLAAKISGKAVTIGGDGTCYPGTYQEKLRYIYIAD